ncbi:MAG: serine hydrolase domain-containing protein [Acidobacteriota bacterium]
MIRFVCAAILSLAMLSPVIAQSVSIESKVDAYVSPYLEARSFSGAILIARGGKILLSKGYGMANYELDAPNTPQTRFHIASISKTFTAAAIMILEERRLLSVNDPLAKFIPDYASGDKITIHHLLTHTSGIPNVNDFADYDAKSKFPQTTDSLVAMFKNRPLLFQPGARYSYSNSNYNLLAFIIEKVSGKSYGDFLRENIFDPLRMRDTAHDARPQSLIKNRACGYVPVGARELENAPYLDWTIKTGNGSLYSTVEDLYKWDRALYTEKILKRATLDKIFTPHIDGVGYGWFVSRRHNRRAIRMNGRSPGFQCEIQRYTDDNLFVAVLSNYYSGALNIDDIAAIALGEKYEAFELARSGRIDPKQLDSLTGRYQGGADFIRPNARLAVERRGDDLFLNWGGGFASALIPLADGSFLDRLFGGRVSFVKDDKGAVTQLIWHSGRDYPARRVTGDG